MVIHRWEALADADGAHRSHEQTHAARKVSIEPVSNGFTIDGECGVAQGAAMREILDRFADTEFLADWDEARARLGENVTRQATSSAPPAQRRMDALHSIFMAAATTPPGGKAPELAVDIVVDQATFEAAMAAMVSRHAARRPPATDRRSDHETLRDDRRGRRRSR